MDKCTKTEFRRILSIKIEPEFYVFGQPGPKPKLKDSLTITKMDGGIIRNVPYNLKGWAWPDRTMKLDTNDLLKNPTDYEIVYPGYPNNVIGIRKNPKTKKQGWHKHPVLHAEAAKKGHLRKHGY